MQGGWPSPGPVVTTQSPGFCSVLAGLLVAADSELHAVLAAKYPPTSFSCQGHRTVILPALGVACGGLLGYAGAGRSRQPLIPPYCHNGLGESSPGRREPGLCIKLHTWHGDVASVHMSHVLALPGRCSRPRPMD